MLEARTALFTLRLIDVIGDSWASAPNRPTDGYVRFTVFFLFCRFHILVRPSPRPAQRNSEFLEKARELTGEFEETNWAPPEMTVFKFAWMTCTFFPLLAAESTIYPSSYPWAIIWLLWLQAKVLILVPV